MFIIFLASIVGCDPAAVGGIGGKHAASFADAAPRDVQQIAIDTITGRSLLSSRSDGAPPEERRTSDPQAEIVDRITGRKVTHPAVLQGAEKGIDLQSAIVRSITGQY